MFFFKRVFLSFFILLYVIVGSNLIIAEPAQAQANRQIIIRDTEIEGILRKWSSEIIETAGLTPDQVNIILVQSPDVNAFVAGGPNIFIYTGLILKTDNAGEVIGVMAHELGHIAGGHLSRMREAASNASFESMIATILGVSAALATGQGGAAAAGAAIGQSMGMNRFLAFSRVQESSADQAGFNYMIQAGMNPTGLVTFLEKLSSQEFLPASQQSAYMRTHPLTSDRIASMRARLEQSPLRNKSLPKEWTEDYARVKAKLTGFITPAQVQFLYPARDQSFAALYARAIAAYRLNKVNDALRLADELVRLEPQNPFTHEMRGQILYDFGRSADSIPSYEKALSLAPYSGLIRTALAQSMLDQNQKSKESLQKIINHLLRAEKDEPRSSRIKRLLATAYGRMGEEIKARVFLAEEALMQGRLDDAKAMAQSALPKLPPGSREILRAEDIINSVDQIQKNS
jgi:predicted Zn-dependent protease